MSSEWAAWVQAVGSVGAIAVAILVGRSSDRRARDLIDNERKRQAGIAAAGAAALVKTVQARGVLGADVLRRAKKSPYGIAKHEGKASFIAADSVLERITVTTSFDSLFPLLLVLDREAGQMVMLVAHAIPAFNENMGMMLRRLSKGIPEGEMDKALDAAIEQCDGLVALCEGTLKLLSPAHAMSRDDRIKPE